MKLSNVASYSNIYLKNQTNMQKMSFGATEIADVTLPSSKKQEQAFVYQIDRKDVPSLKSILCDLDIAKFYPEDFGIYQKGEFLSWNRLVHNALDNLLRGAKGLLLVRDNKPCGIVAYSDYESKSGYFINNLAAWPTKYNEGTKCGGKILMRQVFDDAIKNDKKSISLRAADLNPRDKSCVSFYEELSFLYDEDNYTYYVDRNLFSVVKNYLDRFQIVKQIDKSEDVDLKNILKRD